jgi:uncharacterized low-complexity protein
MKGKAADAACGAGKCSVDMMDTNKDGKVDKAEFVKHHEGMFDKLDTNKDGAIDKAELAKWKEGMGVAPAAKSGSKPAAKPAAKAMEGKCGEGKCGANMMK